MKIKTEGKSPKELYKLLTGAITPRPIAFVSTKSKAGINNVAPFSFFNIVSSNPPTIVFAIGEKKEKQKDTLNNIRESLEFVINIVDVKLVEKVNKSAIYYDSEISEFEEAGLTPIKTDLINSVAVKEAPIHMECKLDRIIKVGKAFMVIGVVKQFYIADELYIADNKIDFRKLNPLARFAGGYYGEIGNYFKFTPVSDKEIEKKR